MFGGCGGAGVTITPIAFMLIQDGEVTIKHISGSDSAAEKMVNLVPGMFDKVPLTGEVADDGHDAQGEVLVELARDRVTKCGCVVQQGEAHPGPPGEVPGLGRREAPVEPEPSLKGGVGEAGVDPGGVGTGDGTDDVQGPARATLDGCDHLP